MEETNKNKEQKDDAITAAYMLGRYDGRKEVETRAEKAEKELDGADSEIASLKDELEDSRGTEKDAPHVLCETARLVGVYEHCQELGDDMGAMTLEAVQDLIADKQKAESNAARLTKMAQLLSEWCAQFESGHTLEEIGLALSNGMACPEPWQYAEESARRAVADSEVE